MNLNQINEKMNTNNDNINPEKVILFSELRDALIGPNKRKRDTLLVPLTLGGQTIKTNEERMVERAFESCAFKTGLSCVMGFGLGAAIGLFSASVGPEVSAPENQSVRQVLKDMKLKTMSYAKNFAILGAMFAAIECTIESVFFCFDLLSFLTFVLMYSTEERLIGRMGRWRGVLQVDSLVSEVCSVF